MIVFYMGFKSYQEGVGASSLVFKCMWGTQDIRDCAIIIGKVGELENQREKHEGKSRRKRGGGGAGVG